MSNFEMYNKKQFDSLYRDLQEDMELKDILAVRLAEQGISRVEADKVIHAVLHNVAAYETVENALSEDASAAFEAFLQDSKRMNGYDRKVLLHQLYFGLKLYQDPELAEKRMNGASVDALFRDYYAQQGENPAVTEEMLENGIRELVSGYRISPAAMRAFAWDLQHGKDMLVTSEAMGEQGYRLKCLATMDLYLRNQGRMTVEEATATACSSVDLQAAADASSRGMLTDDTLRLILCLAALGVALYGAHYFFTGDLRTPLVNRVLVDEIERYDLPGFLAEEVFADAAMIPEKADIGAALGDFHHMIRRERADRIADEKIIAGFLWAVSGVIAVCSKSFAAMAGRLTAKHQFVRNAEELRSAEALHAAAERAEAEDKAAAARKTEEQTREQQNEARRQAFEQEQEKAKNASRMRVFG